MVRANRRIGCIALRESAWGTLHRRFEVASLRPTRLLSCRKVMHDSCIHSSCASSNGSLQRLVARHFRVMTYELHHAAHT